VLAEETVIEEVVSFVLHNNVPVALVDKVEVPLQLSTTLTSGTPGVGSITATMNGSEETDVQLSLFVAVIV
jgi:hypothetical protein